MSDTKNVDASITQIKSDGRYRLNDFSTLDGFTLGITGNLGAATIHLDREISRQVWPIYDGGPITAATVDNFGRPAREIIIQGRADAVYVIVTGANADTNFTVVAG